MSKVLTWEPTWKLCPQKCSHIKWNKLFYMLLKPFTSFVYWNIFGKFGWTFGTCVANIFGKSELSDSQAFWNYYDVCMCVCVHIQKHIWEGWCITIMQFGNYEIKWKRKSWLIAKQVQIFPKIFFQRKKFAKEK